MPTISIQFIGSVLFPKDAHGNNFILYGGVQGDPIYLRDGAWLLTVTGEWANVSNSFGSHLFYLFDMVSPAVYVGKLTNARGVSKPAANKVWSFAIQGGTNGSPDKLNVYVINGILPAVGQESFSV